MVALSYQIEISSKTINRNGTGPEVWYKMDTWLNLNILKNTTEKVVGPTESYLSSYEISTIDHDGKGTSLQNNRRIQIAIDLKKMVGNH